MDCPSPKKRVRSQPSWRRTLDKRLLDYLTNCDLSRSLSAIVRFGIVKLGPYCNAKKSKGFTDADCDPSNVKTMIGSANEFVVLYFNDLFSKGFELIEHFRNYSQDVESREEEAIMILNRYFTEKEQHEQSLIKVLQDTNGKQSVSDITVALTNHLIEKLSPGQSSTIDSRMTGKRKCKCGFQHCRSDPKFGHTGIGNAKVWHGYPDVVLASHPDSSDIASAVIPDSSDIAVTVVPNSSESSDDEDEDDESYERKTMENVKHQTYAQTIVFSYIQKKRNPYLDNFLIPNILLSPKEFRIIMYDSVNDILLCSGEIALFQPPPAESLDVSSIIILWMVLHYRLFCEGIDILRIPDLNAIKSNFTEIVGDKFDLYSDCSEVGIHKFAPLHEESMPPLAFLQRGKSVYI